MDDLHDILAHHHGRPRSPHNKGGIRPDQSKKLPTSSEIPDLLFDEVLIENRLGRAETLVLLFIYRQVWCRPNLFKTYGYTPVMGYDEMAKKMGLDLDELFSGIRRLEALKLIETIRSGQYFVRKYLTEDRDLEFGQSYDDF